MPTPNHQKDYKDCALCASCIPVLEQYKERMVTAAERKEGTTEQNGLSDSTARHTMLWRLQHASDEPTAQNAKSKLEKEILGTLFNCNQTKMSHLLLSKLGS